MSSIQLIFVSNSAFGLRPNDNDIESDVYHFISVRNIYDS